VRARPLDLPLQRDGSFLAWIIAVIVFIAALALAAGLVLSAALQRWDRGLAGTLTVQVPPAASLERALALLRATPGVRAADPLDPAATSRLLEPWLGDLATGDALKLPLLIDVRLDDDAALDLPQLRRRLGEATPGAVIDDHGAWLAPVLGAARLVEAALVLVLVVVVAAAVLVVVFATRTGLAVHHDTIELLHLMGARAGYIARQFERQALRLTMRGGAGGLCGAAALLGLILVAAGRQGGAAPGVSLFGEPGVWIAFVALPVAVAVAAALTARLTVLRRLGQLP
jgi:cell division transport system permease protein